MIMYFESAIYDVLYTGYKKGMFCCLCARSGNSHGSIIRGVHSNPKNTLAYGSEKATLFITKVIVRVKHGQWYMYIHIIAKPRSQLYMNL